jgi:NADH-quinone oxidoreductase subunit J
MNGNCSILSGCLAAGGIYPLAILLLCVLAGIGTLRLLPSRREGGSRQIGGIIVTVSLLAFVALALHATANALNDTGIYFWLFSIIAIVGAIRVVTHPRPVYSALYFVLTVFASAGLFVLLAADFMAAALVLIYAGAILITYVFVIMLASQATAREGSQPLAGLADYDTTSREPFVAVCTGFGMMGVILFLIFDKAQAIIPQPQTDIVTPGIAGPTQLLGDYLFKHQLVNLELAGLILTLAMIGAIVIARRKIVETSTGTEEVEEVIGMATPVDDNPHSVPVVGTTNPRQKAYPET